MSTSMIENSTEQRRKRRIDMAERLDVMDAHTGAVLGQLVNLSADGLMLVGPGCIAPGTLYQLTIPLETATEAEPLVVGAESLWCQDANQSGAYWCGFQIIDISPQHRLVLAAIVGD